MAHTDPARPKRLTFTEKRLRDQEDCRQTPCRPVQNILDGKDGWPICVLCLYEGKLRQLLG